MHGQLFEEEELPDGVPLVSHPIWLALAQALRFSLFQRKEVRRRRHINLSELESILEVEERLARSQGDIRYLLGSDSQVALAAILKGRSSSPSLNKVLQRGLATVIGSGLYGSYGYVPSLANVGDDPTRGVAVRSPERPVPEWLASALLGDFAVMDGWLAAQGYDPLHLANLDFLKDSSDGDGVDRHALDSQLLAELRSVQKPGRMQRFLNSSLPEVGQKQESFTQDSKIRDTCTDATGSSVGRVGGAEGRVAPVPSGCTDLVGVDQQKEKSRGHEKPCKGKKESCNKRHQDPIRTPPTSGGNKEPVSAVVSSHCERVAPPEEVGKVGTTSSKELPKGRRLRRAMAEHSNSPLLSADSREALRLLPAHMAEHSNSPLLSADSREALRLLPAHMAEHSNSRLLSADGREALRLLPAHMAEHSNSPLLSADSREALRLLPAHMFLLPGGRRAPDEWDPSCLQRRGVLDLYSGDAGVARALCKKFGVWVLTVDFAHGPEQDLLQPELQALLCRLARMETFLGLGAAPECCSFSRAVTPAVRSAEYPLGKPGISLNMQKKVAAGNSHAEFLLKILGIFVELGLAYWVENPDGSFLWMLPAWMAAGLGRQESSFRFDMCQYSTPWRKRTRIATSTALRGLRCLCPGGHSHLTLRGRSSAHGMCWTRVAQKYPKELCLDLAWAMAAQMGLTPKQPKLHVAHCAKCTNARVGEAQNPGPRHAAPRVARDVQQLEEVRLVNKQTQVLQDRVWADFNNWVCSVVSLAAAEQLFLCPQLAVDVLVNYGKSRFAAGAPMYEFRHLLVLAQQSQAGLRAHMTPAWRLLSKWEAVQPLQHRQPLPEVLFRAMFVVGMLWGWRRWSATLLLGFEGIARIGEVLRASRADLVLPCDSCDSVTGVAFLRVLKPKSSRRGKGRIQHLKIADANAVSFLEHVFGPLDFSLQLFPLSAGVFRRRWDKILEALLVPKSRRPTPASIRGGGAILAYKRGEPISDILWRMRLVSLTTLESYLQELAADSLLTRLPERSRCRIRSAAALFDLQLRSPG